MTPKLRLGAAGTMGAMAIALWIATAQVDPDPTQLWVGAILVSLLALVLRLWSIVGFMTKKADNADGKGGDEQPAFFHLEAPNVKANEWRNIETQGIDRLVKIRATESAEGNVFEDIRRTEDRPMEHPSSSSKARRIWSFPELPWKRKKESAE